MLKRASRKLRSTPAKTLMYIILFLVLFLAIFSMMMIGIASGNKVKRAQETLANSITLRGPAEGEAGKSCTVYAIPSAIVEKFIDSNYVQGYTMEAGTYWLDPVDTETYISEETQQRLKGYLKDSGMYTMTAVGTLDCAYDTYFLAKGYRIVEGSGLSYGERGKYEAVVGEKYAEKNHLHVGDTVKYKMEQGTIEYYKVSAPEEISFKIRGIYRTPEVYQSDSVVNDWHNNLIFIPLDIFCEYSMKALKIQNVGFNTVTVYLKDTKSVEPFIEETKNKIKIGSVDDVVQTDENGIRSSVKPMVISQQDLESGEWSYQLIRNKEWYEMVAKPVEKLNRLIGYMIVGFVTAGILLFGILTSLSVKGRKREIGILLSMGEHRKRILGQFVLENLVPVLIALVFAALCATPTAEYFADRMISNQAEKVEQENEDLSGNIKNALPTSEIAAYESTGVTVDTDLSIEWNWKIMTGMILGILDLFLLILILQVGKITRESPASILLDRK